MAPTIQAASIRALNKGTTPMKVLEIAKQIKADHDVPIVIMTYYNPVFRIGLEKFLTEAKTHGVNGFIVPDLPVEEAEDFKTTADAHGLDTIFLAAPLHIKPAATQNRRCLLRVPVLGFTFRRYRRKIFNRRLNIAADSACSTIHGRQDSLSGRFWHFPA